MSVVVTGKQDSLREDFEMFIFIYRVQSGVLMNKMLKSDLVQTGLQG